MPLDDFQKEIVSLLRVNRAPENVFAGESVIQMHGFRLSSDQDVFTSSTDLDTVAQKDIDILKSKGFSIIPRKSYDGFREFLVLKPGIGRTALQWTHGLSKEFFSPVSDPLFGYRLHFADLAVNKTLAAASRQQKRDFIDLWMIDRHVVPLWRLVCAASGKDISVNPFSAIERIARNFHFASVNPGDPINTTFEISFVEIGNGIRDSIDKARGLLPSIPPEHYGKLALQDNGQPEVASEFKKRNRWIAPKIGGCMPAFEGMDSEMIAGLIAEFGPEGSRITGTAPSDPEIEGTEGWQPPEPSPFD